MVMVAATKDAIQSPAPSFCYAIWWRRCICVVLALYPTAVLSFAPCTSPLLAIDGRRLPLTTTRTKTATVHSLARAGGSYFGSSPEEPDGWTPDNFPRDRDNLEHMIRIATERTRPLPPPTTFQKRRVDRGLVSFARTQLLCSAVVAMVLQGNRSLQQYLGMGLALHGWLCLVVPPLGLLAYIRWNKRKYQASTVLPIDVDDNDRTETPYYPFWNRDQLDSAVSGHNYPLCLPELWCSAVVGLIAAVIVPGNNRRRFYFGWIMARLGVWSALHQYPEQWWHLEQDDARPVSFPVYSLRFCTSLLWTRWMVVLEVARYVAAVGWSWRQIGFLYASSLTVCLGGALAAAKIDPERLQQRVKSIIDPKVLRSLIRAIVLVQVGKTVWRNFTPASVALVDWWSRSPVPPRLLSSFRKITWWTCVGLAPACHIAAALRLLRIHFTSEDALLEHLVDKKDGVGTGQDKRACTAALASDGNTTGTAHTPNTWRYSRIWRTPRRLSYTLRQWRRETLHWLYFGGQVIDQLNRPERYNPELIQHMTPELKSRLRYNPVPEHNNRTEWVELASNEVARIHQANYEAGIKDVRCKSLCTGALMYSPFPCINSLDSFRRIRSVFLYSKCLASVSVTTSTTWR